MIVEIGLTTLRDEQKLRVSENRVLMRISGPNREEVVGGWRNCIISISVIICTVHQILLGS
jgi:hypothetical protein